MTYPYDISFFSKWLISIDEKDKKRTICISNAEKDKPANWVVSSKVSGEIYLNDKILEIKGLSKAWNGRLNSLGITLVGQLKELNERKICLYCEQSNGIVKVKISEKFVANAQCC